MSAICHESGELKSGGLVVGTGSGVSKSRAIEWNLFKLLFQATLRSVLTGRPGLMIEELRLRGRGHAVATVLFHAERRFVAIALVVDAG